MVDPLRVQTLLDRLGQETAAPALDQPALFADDAPSTSTGQDCLLGLIGLVNDLEGPDDVAVNHDHYLYGVSKAQ